MRVGESPLVLIIEDEADTARMMANSLARDGIRTMQAASALPGLHMARLRRPDLILMDIELPGLRGATAAMALQDDPALVGVPVIFVSGRPDLEDLAREAGAAGVLFKPLNPLELAGHVRRYLQGRPTHA